VTLDKSLFRCFAAIALASSSLPDGVGVGAGTFAGVVGDGAAGAKVSPGPGAIGVGRTPNGSSDASRLANASIE